MINPFFCDLYERTYRRRARALGAAEGPYIKVFDSPQLPNRPAKSEFLYEGKGVKEGEIILSKASIFSSAGPSDLY